MKKLIVLMLAMAVFGCVFLGCANSDEAVLSEIKITKAPDKVAYEAGEMFDSSGIEVTAYFEDGSFKVITDYTILLSGALFQGVTQVTVKYGEMHASQPVTVMRKGNTENYSVASTEKLTNSPLAGKTYYFLGSSVTLGTASMNESMADFIAKRNDCTVVKEAIGGTTIADNGKTSYVSRISNFDKTKKPDVFICQLSTNDANLASGATGEISASKDIKDFDKTTTYGGIEYIIAYAQSTWDCDVMFYTNSYYKNTGYTKMVTKIKAIQSKWGITVLDLYSDEQFNDITDDQRALYMQDNIHPTRAGYREWWTPKFEECLKRMI